MEEQKGSGTAGEISALVCEADQDLRGRIGNSLKLRGYNPTFAETAADAIGKMRLQLFNVVVVDELFDAAGPEANEVLKYLGNQNMTTRRRFFVALVGRDLRTNDNMAAFSHSVNIVVNAGNIDEIGDIVKHGAADNAEFYQIFNETLKKVGKG
ncbi:MAG: hypothetical protein M0P74_10345 [Syntrophales bacterium]|jgi:ActR/RegA family two-component response regulator|nr:hypothetical protein [Syntrophales bacterium]